MFSFVKRTFLGVVVLAFFSIGGFVFYVETSVNHFFEEEDLNTLYSEINNSPALPPSFYDTYDKYEIELFETSVWFYYFNTIQTLGYHDMNCPCLEMYLPWFEISAKKSNWFSSYIFRIDLEENCSQQNCFEYNMSIAEFGDNTRGIVEATQKFYDKELTELNEREILGFLLMLQSSYFYNPRTNLENLNEGIDRLMMK